MNAPSSGAEEPDPCFRSLVASDQRSLALKQVQRCLEVSQEGGGRRRAPTAPPDLHEEND